MLHKKMPPYHIALSLCKAEVAGRAVYFGFYCVSDGSDTVYHAYSANRKFLYQFRHNNDRWLVYKNDLLLKKVNK